MLTMFNYLRYASCHPVAIPSPFELILSLQVTKTSGFEILDETKLSTLIEAM